jgi:hypothetical protein
MDRQDEFVNQLLIFTTLLNEATKWLMALEHKGLRHEAKWTFKKALEATRAYERFIIKNSQADIVKEQEEVAEPFSEMIMMISKMDLETKNRFSQHISKFFDEN